MLTPCGRSSLADGARRLCGRICYGADPALPSRLMSLLMSWLRPPVAIVLVVTNLLIHGAPLLALALVKAIVPLIALRRRLSRALTAIGESWIAVNHALIVHLGGTRIDVRLPADGLRHDGWYLVVANHQSWVDIPVIQSVLNRRIPFLRFFLKSELIWVPVLGLAWWALDFPFMKRYSKEQLQRRPELRGKDAETTRETCRKFRDIPVSVMNFAEGTRFTPAKHARQSSPYRDLLKPRAGGVTLVFETMGELLDAVVDVSVYYPQGRPTLLDLIRGRVRDVRVDVRCLPVPAELVAGDYENDPASRERAQRWIGALWADKDARIAALRAADTGGIADPR